MSLAACFLFAAIYLVFYTGSAFAAATYTVAADGTGCSAIGTWDAGTKTCTLTGDITLGSGDNDNAIELTGDGVTLDGGHHTITGKTSLGSGITATGRGNFTIRNFDIKHFTYGIDLESTTLIIDKSHVTSNVVEQNSFGIYLHFASDVAIESNYVGENTAYGIMFSSACSNNDIVANIMVDNQAGAEIMGGSNNLAISHNLITNNAYPGLSLDSVGNSSIDGNYISSNGTNGIAMVATASNYVRNNTITANGGSPGTGVNYGISLYDSNGDMVYHNNFVGNANQAGYGGTGTGTAFDSVPYGGNYWNPHPSTSGPCVNNNADDFCDGPMILSLSPPMQDNHPYALRNGWGSDYFTWYDNVGGQNWVLAASADSALPETAWLDLFIGGAAKNLATLSGPECGSYPCWPGELTVGKSMAMQYDGLVGGPVEFDSRDGTPFIASQRTLWPRSGGSSLEEVPAINAQDLSDHYWWPWYDEASPGFQNWVLLDNPNSFDIYYSIRLAGTDISHGKLEAGSPPLTLDFPGRQDGPLDVQAWVFGTWNPAKIIASQRVLTNGGRAFNEVPGIPNGKLTDDNVWTWYDNIGGQNWILIANPNYESMRYQIEVGGGCAYGPWPPGTDFSTMACVQSGSGGVEDIPAGGRVFQQLDGKRGGPVEVKTTKASDGVTPLKAVVSQRSLWGSSFEESPGFAASALSYKYEWTWYDQATPGSANWVLVANMGSSSVHYAVSIGGIKIDSSCAAIDPGTEQTPAFPMQIGGPVEVKEYSDSGCTTPASSSSLLASQRVLWNGYFNEVLGYPLS